MAMAHSFPRARCVTCGKHDRCADLGRAEPEYPRCHRPLLHGHLARHRSLFERLCADPHPDGGAVAAMVERLLERFDRDRRAVSEVLEPSLSWDRAGWHRLRFSYAFHGYRRDTAGATRSTLAMIAPFGDAALGYAAPILRLAEDETCVHQLMFGYAADGPGRARLKLYLQFTDDAGAAALRVADRLVPGLDASGRFAGSALHLLGIDFEGGRLIGAKLYLLERRRLLDGTEAVALFDDLRAADIRELSDVLWIHRFDPLQSPRADPLVAPPPAVRAGEGGVVPGAVEVDFSLAENELRWAELSALPSIARHRGAGSPLLALETEFRLAIRRLSVPVGAPDKLNVYYMLAESEPAVPQAPGARGSGSAGQP